MAGLLRQPALWSLLEQGRHEPFIAEVLATPDAESLADLLTGRLPDDPERANLLAKSLKRVVVKVVRFQDFKPAKSTVERGDVEAVVDDFRRFLQGVFGKDGKDQSVIMDLDP